MVTTEEMYKARGININNWVFMRDVDQGNQPSARLWDFVLLNTNLIQIGSNVLFGPAYHFSGRIPDWYLRFVPDKVSGEFVIRNGLYVPVDRIVEIEDKYRPKFMKTLREGIEEAEEAMRRLVFKRYST